MAIAKPVTGTGKTKSPAKVGKNRRPEMEVTAVMKSAITECKKLVRSGSSKAEAAREAFGVLKKHERRQVIHVFMQGCGLSKAGAGTYYQNCKSS